MKLINVSSWMISMKSCLTSWCWCYLRGSADQCGKRSTCAAPGIRSDQPPPEQTLYQLSALHLHTVIFLCVFSACEWQQRWRRKGNPLNEAENTPTARDKTLRNSGRLCVNTEQYNMITQPSCAVEEGELTLCFQIGLPQWCWSKINNGKFEFNPLFPKINLNH